MMGMLMSVRMMSNLPVASLRRPSTPSSASVTRRFLSLDSASTRSCRIIGESSTTRHEYWAVMSMAFPSSSLIRSRGPRRQILGARFAQNFRARQLAVGLAPEIGGDESRPRMGTEELEKLAVDGHEPLLVLEQRVKGDDADDAVLQLEWDACCQRGCALSVRDVGYARQVGSLDCRLDGIDRGFAQRDCRERRKVDPLGGNGEEALCLLVREVDRQRSHADELAEQLLDVAQDAPHAE